MNATRDASKPGGIELHRMLFNPYSLWSVDGLDKALGSAINSSLSKFDQYFTTELTERLFQSSNESQQQSQRRFRPGLDLVSLNIQRGRDHGLAAYGEWRKHCRLPSVDTWHDLEKAVDATSFEGLKAIYRWDKFNWIEINVKMKSFAVNRMTLMFTRVPWVNHRWMAP